MELRSKLRARRSDASPAPDIRIGFRVAAAILSVRPSKIVSLIRLMDVFREDTATIDLRKEEYQDMYLEEVATPYNLSFDDFRKDSFARW